MTAETVLNVLCPLSTVFLTDFESEDDYKLLKTEDVEQGWNLNMHREVGPPSDRAYRATIPRPDQGEIIGNKYLGLFPLAG